MKETIIDHGFEAYSPYKSACATCKYFDVTSMSCNAFTKGIPEHYLSGEKKHDKVDKDQNGEFVFTPLS